MLARLVSLALIWVPMAPVTVLAQAATPGSSPPTGDLGSGLGQLMLGLAGVLMLLIGSLWLLKKLLAPRGEGRGLLRIVSGLAVGARERIVVVEVGSTWLVLGVAPGHISSLAEIPRQTMPATDTPSPAGFPEWLKSLPRKK